MGTMIQANGEKVLIFGGKLSYDYNTFAKTELKK
jgi:hypothetical protein